MPQPFKLVDVHMLMIVHGILQEMHHAMRQPAGQQHGQEWTFAPAQSPQMGLMPAQNPFQQSQYSPFAAVSSQALTDSHYTLSPRTVSTHPSEL